VLEDRQCEKTVGMEVCQEDPYSGRTATMKAESGGTKTTVRK
jgi:hypothetical protein